MYKLLVLDMDGTLLNNNKQISQGNKNAIESAVEAGVKVSICTGRLLEGIEIYLKELNFISSDNYSITCSGSLIQNNTKTKMCSCNNLSIEDMNYVRDLCKRLKLAFNIFSDGAILASHDSLFNQIDAQANRVPLKIMNMDGITEGTMMTKFTLINEDITVDKELRKICPSVRFDSSNLKPKPNFNKDLFNDKSCFPKEFLEKYTVLKTSPFTYEVLKKSSNKGEGVRLLSEKLGIKREEIICIGDSGNDKHMIKYAGLGVAMGNAFDDIKRAADYVTLTNEEDGVAHVINKFILKETA